MKRILIAILLSITHQSTYSINPPQHDLVELIKLDPTFVLDIRYATKNNFTGEILYTQPRAFLRRCAADKLVAVQKELKKHNLGLKIFDGYRPVATSQLMWDFMKKKYPHESDAYLSQFVMPPSKGSRHNLGLAIDVTLINLSDKSELEMPTPYDDFTEKANAYYRGTDVSAQALKNRDFLIKIMESHGFKVLQFEWWHYDQAGWEQYKNDRIDIPFEQL